MWQAAAQKSARRFSIGALTFGIVSTAGIMLAAGPGGIEGAGTRTTAAVAQLQTPDGRAAASAMAAEHAKVASEHAQVASQHAQVMGRGPWVMGRGSWAVGRG